MRQLVATVMIALLGTGCSDSVAPRDRMHDLPAIFLWAWENREDLRLAEPDMGVAYLAATIQLRDDRFLIQPRAQTLLFNPAAALIAVFRIESTPNAVS